MINITQYKPHSEVTKEILRDNNFRYMDGYYSYRFCLSKYKKKQPTLWCNIYINLEHNNCGFSVINNDGNIYPAFYNRAYGGRNKVIEEAEKKIQSQLDILVKQKILKVKKNVKN
jgi:hypothetical protein